MFVIHHIWSLSYIYLSTQNNFSATNNSDSCFPQGFMRNTPEGGLVAGYTKWITTKIYLGEMSGIENHCRG